MTDYAAMTDTEIDAAIAEMMGTPFQKPGHGPCCTCRTCGWHYDECKCHREDDCEFIYTELEPWIERQGLAPEYIEYLSGVVLPRDLEHLCNEGLTWRIRRATPRQCCEAALMAKEYQL